jgi:LysR family transcriptional regulator, nod-box dependent transcriptional activator
MSDKTNLRRFNLNALPALREILRHGNLTKAAKALNLTQPALSNILKQLRSDFGDELIVRESNRMRLTPKGEQLIAPLERTLHAVESLLSGKTFDALQSNGHFRIATTDFIAGLVGPKLLSILSAEAPDIECQFLLARRSMINEMLIGDVDMMIIPRMTMGGGFADAATLAQVSIYPLVTERLVCIGRKDDAELASGLSVSAYLKRPHISFIVEAQANVNMERAFLAQMGLTQSDRFLVSGFEVIPRLVADSGCIALIPESLAKAHAADLPIMIVDPPIAFPPMEFVMVSHQRGDADPMQNWFRSTLLRSIDSRDGA